MRLHYQNLTATRIDHYHFNTHGLVLATAWYGSQVRVVQDSNILGRRLRYTAPNPGGYWGAQVNNYNNHHGTH